MLKSLSFISFLLIVSQTFGQITVSGVIKDKDGHPVPAARCWYKNNPDYKVASNRNGKFEIYYEYGELDTLVFSSVGFDRAFFYISKKVESKARKRGELIVNIVLPDRVFNIITIRPEEPDTMHGTQAYSVQDFAYNQNGELVLLTYYKTLRRGSSLRLLDENHEVIDSLELEEESIELQTDFRDNIHLISDKNVYWVNVEDEKLKLYKEDREFYLKNVAPIVDTVGKKVYYSTYSEVYPAFDYYEYDVDDSSHSKLIYIEDSFIMPFYRAEFKYLPQRTKLELHRKQIETGIDKEIWAGALYFTKTMYYEPIYAPLFRTANDSVLVFDHYKNLMFKYNPASGFSDSLRITYHHDSNKSGWAQPLIQDESTRNIYAVFERAGNTYLREISKESGEILRSFKLHHKYVEGMQIRDGKVLYIYRPFESPQKKYLYSEKLKMTAGS